MPIIIVGYKYFPLAFSKGNTINIISICSESIKKAINLPSVEAYCVLSVLMFVNFIYLKTMATFCQVEMVRTVADTIFPFLVVLFSLV